MFIAARLVIDGHRQSVKRITIRRRDVTSRQFRCDPLTSLTNLHEPRVRNDDVGHGSLLLHSYSFSRSCYTTLTFSPRGPLGPCPRSKVTACPSRSSSNEV